MQVSRKRAFYWNIEMRGICSNIVKVWLVPVVDVVMVSPGSTHFQDLVGTDLTLNSSTNQGNPFACATVTVGMSHSGSSQRETHNQGEAKYVSPSGRLRRSMRFQELLVVPCDGKMEPTLGWIQMEKDTEKKQREMEPLVTPLSSCRKSFLYPTCLPTLKLLHFFCDF